MVHVPSFHAYPQEGAERQVVQEEGHRHAQLVITHVATVRTHDVEHVEEDHGETEVDEDLPRAILMQNSGWKDIKKE